MKTILTLIVRLFITFILAWISFSYWYNADLFFRDILGISIIATATNYFMGDLLVLPRLGNISASILGGVSAAIIAYFVIISTTNIVTTLTPIIVFAILITFIELFIHIFLTITKPVVEDKQDILNHQRNNNLNFNTEFGEELQPTSYYNNSRNSVTDTLTASTGSNFEINRIKSNIENPNV